MSPPRIAHPHLGANLTFMEWGSLIASLAILTGLCAPLVDKLHAEEPAAATSNPPPCYGPSGFPEVAKLYLWESNPNHCTADCECSERNGHLLDPVNNRWLLLIPRTSTSYSIAYADQGAEPANTSRYTCVWNFKRLASGSIEISADPAYSSFSFYSIYDRPPKDGGKPLPNLYRVQDVKHHPCIQTISANAVTVIPGQPCTP